jgi:MFS superfamily sulfate permease-like transporter
VFYANAQAVRDAIDDAVTGPEGRVRVVALDLDANDEIDITTSEQLMKLKEGLDRRGAELCFVHLHAPALRMARETGLLEQVSPDHEPANAAPATAAKGVNGRPSEAATSTTLRRSKAQERRGAPEPTGGAALAMTVNWPMPVHPDRADVRERWSLFRATFTSLG